MLSTLIRQCSSSMGKEKLFWKSVVDPKEFVRPEEETMIIGIVRDRRQTNDLLRQLNEIFPWPNALKHVRRLNQLNEELHILLYPTKHSHPKQNEFQETFFHSDRFSSADIPLSPFQLKSHFDEHLQRTKWKNLSFRPNPTNEFLHQNQPFTDEHLHLLQIFQVDRDEIFPFLVSSLSLRSFAEVGRRIPVVTLCLGSQRFDRRNSFHRPRFSC